MLFQYLIDLLLWVQFWASFGMQSTDQAYVTLLYGDEFLLGFRVLGKSIRSPGSTKDMVVLVSEGVSEYAKKLLQVIESSEFKSFTSWFIELESGKLLIYL